MHSTTQITLVGSAFPVIFVALIPVLKISIPGISPLWSEGAELHNHCCAISLSN